MSDATQKSRAKTMRHNRKIIGFGICYPAHIGLDPTTPSSITFPQRHATCISFLIYITHVFSVLFALLTCSICSRNFTAVPTEYREFAVNAKIQHRLCIRLLNNVKQPSTTEEKKAQQQGMWCVSCFSRDLKKTKRVLEWRKIRNLFLSLLVLIEWCLVFSMGQAIERSSRDHRIMTVNTCV